MMEIVEEPAVQACGPQFLLYGFDRRHNDHPTTRDFFYCAMLALERRVSGTPVYAQSGAVPGTPVDHPRTRDFFSRANARAQEARVAVPLLPPRQTKKRRALEGRFGARNVSQRNDFWHQKKMRWHGLVPLWPPELPRA